MKKQFAFILLLSILCMAQTLFGQVTYIGGVVNTYYQVIEVIPSKSCVKLNSTAGLYYNDKVMVAQMKGASINTTGTSSSFGDTISLNNAGNYEINSICYVHLDTAFLVFGFLNNYTNGEKIQLVKIPQYYSATVMDSLKAAPWDDATSTGGILAIMVEEELRLDAPISADAAGFRGGNYLLSGGYCANSVNYDFYAYSGNVVSPAQGGGFKGESVAVVSAGQSGGRGSAANGGGGGNNHNNSGAGGSNVSAGGDGGGNSSGVGCNEAFVGKGAKPLSSYGGKKVFLGGGGGAGHSNNGTATTRGGGHGGGICFIRAKTINCNGYSISANGQLGGGSIGDGASGGGGGGSIIIDAITYTSSVDIQANGGEGGLSNDGGTFNRCYGGGGGGGAGAIYFSGAQPAGTVQVMGGLKGLETGSAGTCGLQVQAEPGTDGEITTSYNYRRSTVLASYCASVLPTTITAFKAMLVQEQTRLNWKMPSATGVRQLRIERSNAQMDWNTIYVGQPLDNQTNYEYVDEFPLAGYNFYRLATTDLSGAVHYSLVERVFLSTRETAWSIYPNPSSGQPYINTPTSLAGMQLQVFDLTGKLICQQSIAIGSSRIPISLPKCAKGMYVVRIGAVQQRLVVQ